MFTDPCPYPVLLRSTGLHQAVSQAGLLLTGMKNQYRLIKAQKQLTERLRSSGKKLRKWQEPRLATVQPQAVPSLRIHLWERPGTAGMRQTPGAPPPAGNRMLQPLSCPAARAPSHVSRDSRPKQEFRAGTGPRPVGTCVESPGRTAARRALSVSAPLKDTDQHCYRK